MSNSLFYLQVKKNDDNSELINLLESYAISHQIQVYLVDRPLSDSKYSYDMPGALVLLSPDHKVTFINISEDDDDFEEYIEDFIEDLGSLSDKYRYKNKIGRPRKWKSQIIESVRWGDYGSVDALFQYIRLTTVEEKRLSEIILSLLTGSINDSEKLATSVADNILDRVKQKVLLFDGEQTRFIYDKPKRDLVRIQGMSGTGKTELLLHKLKEIYTNPEDSRSKIFLTCHNRVLADSLKKRIPDFFDFMKVEQQILWNERLWCVRAWGSASDRNSGIYAYICKFYEIDFNPYSSGTKFGTVCQSAIRQITEKGGVASKGFAFDYALIDESQDFPEPFIQLCQMVTKNELYVAGDIFQSIFDDYSKNGVEPDYLLSKCYRTDPRTLMFAHALSLGLFETPKLKWLKDDEWEACGYQIEKKNGDFILTREPLRRFEDLIAEGSSSVEIVETGEPFSSILVSKVISIIEQILSDNETATVNDIAVIFIDDGKYIYQAADSLAYQVKSKFGWESNKAYETKATMKGNFFITNKNNVKGLEFPFVICITKKIASYPSYRNSLYTMLTRSFIKSYLLIGEEQDRDVVLQCRNKIEEINMFKRLTLKEPSNVELEALSDTIKYTGDSKPFYDFVYEIFDQIGLPFEHRAGAYQVIKTTNPAEAFDRGMVVKTVEFFLVMANYQND